MNRRRFMTSAAAAALGSTGLQADDSKPKILLPSDSPDEYGFRLMWYNPIAPLDHATYRLTIKGLVDKPFTLSLADLQRLPHESQNTRMKCVQCWSSRATWGGIRFGHLLELAKPTAMAKSVRFDCADKWYEYFTIQDLLKPRVMLAMEMNGKPLADRHGAPLRIIDPGRYGYKCSKAITSLEFVEEGQGSMACDLGPYYSPTGVIQAGYDTPLDLGGKTKRKISGGEITDY